MDDDGICGLDGWPVALRWGRWGRWGSQSYTPAHASACSQAPAVPGARRFTFWIGMAAMAPPVEVAEAAVAADMEGEAAAVTAGMEAEEAKLQATAAAELDAMAVQARRRPLRR